MENYNHEVGVKMVGEAMPDENNRVTLADETDQYGLPITRIHYAWTENDKALIAHGLDQMEGSMQAAGVRNTFRQARTPTISMARRAWATIRAPASSMPTAVLGHPNLWVCDGSVFPTVGGVNPSLTIQAVALRTADRIEAMGRRGEREAAASGSEEHDNLDHRPTARDFAEAVNMTSAELDCVGDGRQQISRWRERSGRPPFGLAHRRDQAEEEEGSHGGQQGGPAEVKEHSRLRYSRMN